MQQPPRTPPDRDLLIDSIMGTFLLAGIAVTRDMVAAAVDREPRVLLRWMVARQRG